ncbi:MAG TPA: TrmB family transcriptional regulator [Nanoarchaeota archaeon]|nr:TrmB family transcriptional regulator [Nanoarchaeota archaeon]
MLVSEKVMDALKSIGLNLYERKIWVALLSRGVASAGELSEIAKIPRSRAYDVLESLADKGFVIIQNSKPLKYVAIDPKEALERAKKQIMKKAEEMIAKIDDLKNSEIIKELDKLYKEGMKVIDPGELTGAIKGRDILYQQLETMFKNAKKYISIFAPPETIKEIHNTHGHVLEKLSSKGVNVKILTNKPLDAEFLENLKKIGEVRKITTSKNTTGRFCLIDGKHVIISLTDHTAHPLQDTAIWASSEHAASVFEHMFDSLWEKAEKFF